MIAGSMPPPKQSKKLQKSPFQHPPTEGLVQGNSNKGKQPFRPPTEQPVQAGSASKIPRQLLLDKSTQTDIEVIQPRPKQHVQSGTEDKQRQEPPAKQYVQSKPKGKQPIRPPSEQPVEARYTGENVQGGSNKGKQPIPLDKSMQADPEVTQPRPKQQVQSENEDKQRQNLPAKRSEQSKSKGKQPMSKLVYGNPRCLIARIPVKKNARIKRVEVSIGPDTALRHPQTFFFKNIPMLEPYWGYLNDKAFTATRIVRLENEGKPTPYFLMVCRGEYPKVKSPRNDNAIFMGMYEPIFGDAFVFKLGDPELYGDGYSRYVHIEDDIGSIDWMPEAIRVAARKVENAMAPEANPGFPDFNNYADRETISKDAERMLNWMRAIRKANKKYAEAFPVDATSGLPDLKRMQDIIKKWTRQVADWKREDVMPVDDSAEPSDFQRLEDFIQKVLAAYKAILDDDTDDEATEDEDMTVSASTDTGSSDAGATDAAEDIQERFLAAKAAFLQVEAIAKKNISKTVLHNLNDKGVADYRKIKAMIDEIMTSAAIWKEENALRPDGEVGYIDPKIFDELIVKIQALYQMMEEGVNLSVFVKAISEVKEMYAKLEAQIEEQEAAESANPKLPDLIGHTGTSRYEV